MHPKNLSLDEPCAGLRSRIENAYEAEKCQTDTGNTARRDFLRILLCWMDDYDEKRRRQGQEKGCSESDILEFLRELRTQKRKTREVHLSESEFQKAQIDFEELQVIDEFLPKALEAEALTGKVKDVIAELGATKLKDLPVCMNVLEEKFPGQIDPKIAAPLMKKALS